MAQWKKIQLVSMNIRVRSLSLLNGSGILGLLWLWCRLASTAPIGPLGWEPLCAAGAPPPLPPPKKKRKENLCILQWFTEGSYLHLTQSSTILGGRKVGQTFTLKLSKEELRDVKQLAQGNVF